MSLKNSISVNELPLNKLYGTGFIKSYKVKCAALFKIFLDEVTKVSVSNHLMQQTKNILNYLRPLHYDKVVQFGSPFLWVEIENFIKREPNNDSSILEINMIFILLNLIDSYFDYLSDETYISFDNKASTYILPLLGATYRIRNKESTKIAIKKISRNKIQFLEEIEDNVVTKECVLVKSENYYYTPSDEESPIVITTFDNRFTSLLPSYHENIDVLYKDTIGNIASKFKKVLEKIKGCDLDFYANICDLIKIIVPLQNVRADSHISSSHNDYLGIIFLSNSNNIRMIFEAIIHEYHHVSLNIAMRTHRFFINDTSLYYSPWRNDPRPLFGLFHAIYVFYCLVLFYNNIGIDYFGADQKYQIKSELDILICKLQVALMQIPLEKLTDDGKTIIDDITATLHNRFVNKGNNITHKLNKSVALHVKNWINKNPAYRDLIQTPQSYSPETFSNVVEMQKLSEFA